MTNEYLGPLVSGIVADDRAQDLGLLAHGLNRPTTQDFRFLGFGATRGTAQDFRLLGHRLDRTATQDFRLLGHCREATEHFSFLHQGTHETIQNFGLVALGPGLLRCARRKVERVVGQGRHRRLRWTFLSRTIARSGNRRRGTGLVDHAGGGRRGNRRLGREQRLQLAGECSCVGEAVPRPACQSPGEQRYQRRRDFQLRSDLRRRRCGLHQHLDRYFGGGLARKWGDSGKHFEQQHPDREHVRPRIAGGTLELLRRAVLDERTVLAWTCWWRAEFGDPEVQDPYSSVGADPHVARPQRAVGRPGARGKGGEPRGAGMRDRQCP